MSEISKLPLNKRQDKDGRYSLRVSPIIDLKIRKAAHKEGRTINSWINRAISKELSKNVE